MKLACLLQPHAVSEFLVDYFGIQPLHVPGDAARFAEPRSQFPGERLDENSRAIAMLARDLERTLEAPVRAQLEAGSWEHAPDRSGCDQFLLQVDGEARCQLWDKTLPEPTGDALRIELQAGGALYVPRGWWFASASRTGRQIRFEVENPTGADLLGWVFEHLKQHEFLAGDLPRFAGPGAQADYLTGLRRVIVRACRTPGLLAHYSRHRNYGAPIRSAGGRPWTREVPGDRLIDFLPSRRLHLRRADAESFAWKCNGKDLHFPLEAAPLLQFLEECAPVPVDDFYGTFDAEFGRADLEDFLSVLAAEGLIAAVDPPTE